jgi:hypothetical protein
MANISRLSQKFNALNVPIGWKCPLAGADVEKNVRSLFIKSKMCREQRPSSCMCPSEQLLTLMSERVGGVRESSETKVVTLRHPLEMKFFTLT